MMRLMLRKHWWFCVGGAGTLLALRLKLNVTSMLGGQQGLNPKASVVFSKWQGLDPTLLIRPSRPPFQAPKNLTDLSQAKVSSPPSRERPRPREEDQSEHVIVGC